MDLYQIYCNVLKDIDRIVYMFQIQDYFNGIKVHKKMLGSLGIILKDELEIITELMECQKISDYLGMADIYDIKIRRICEDNLEILHENGVWQEVSDYYERNYNCSNDSIKSVLDLIDAATEDIPDDYQLIETATGDFMLRKNINFSSAKNPYIEAERMADFYCRSDKAKYIILGLGMAYLSKAVCARENVMKVTVFEHDKYVIKAAFHYMDLSELLKSEKITMVYDPMLTKFANRISKVSEDEEQIIIHRPSMMNIENEQLRMKVQDFFLHDASVKSQKLKLEGNFRMNTGKEALENVQSLESLYDIFHDKNMLLIAAGPSLEDDIPLLSRCTENSVVTEYSSEGVKTYSLSDCVEYNEAEEYIVVCVGTVLSRLVALGIKPDYVVITDPQENMTGQVVGVDASDISLIYIPTVYYKVPKIWNGSKYMGLQNGFRLSQKMAEKDNRLLFETGGSVTTFAFDIGLRFGCKKIVCLGMDFAFTGNMTHAGTGTGINREDKNLRQIKSVNGENIYTSSNLDNYRLWIERRIANRTEEEKKVQVINASGGAYINGMINERLNL